MEKADIEPLDEKTQSLPRAAESAAQEAKYAKPVQTATDPAEIEQYMTQLLERVSGVVQAEQNGLAPGEALTGVYPSPSGPGAEPPSPAPPPSPAVDGDPTPRGGKGPTPEEILGMRAVANRHTHRTLSTQGMIHQAYSKLLLATVAIVCGFALMASGNLLGPVHFGSICVTLLVAVLFSGQYLVHASRLAQVPQEEEETTE